MCKYHIFRPEWKILLFLCSWYNLMISHNCCFPTFIVLFLRSLEKWGIEVSLYFKENMTFWELNLCCYCNSPYCRAKLTSAPHNRELCQCRHLKSHHKMAFWRTSSMNRWETVTLVGLKIGMVICLYEGLYLTKFLWNVMEWLTLFYFLWR